jgi:hypothetical protein
MKIVIKKITPATIESNIEELDKYIIEIESKYSGILVTEDFILEGKEERAKLNKLKKNLSEVRKKVEKDGLSVVQNFILKLKEAEKTVDNLSNNINKQIKEFEAKEKNSKLDWIEATIDEISNDNCFNNAKKYIQINTKWLNKAFSFENIKKELIEQIKKLNEKYNFILAQLEACNEEIENKLIFDDVESRFNCTLDEILKYILEKKNQIKTTEENMRKKAEREKQEAIQAEKEKAAKEQQDAIEKAKEEERKKLELDIEKYENPEHYRNTNDIENKNYSIEDYVTLQIKILKKDVETAKLLKQFLEKNNIEYKKL